MSENTINSLVETRKRVISDVNLGLISVATGAQILGITRVGLWKLRKTLRSMEQKQSLVESVVLKATTKSTTVLPIGSKRK